MPLSSIAQIFLRLYALNLFVTGLIQLVAVFAFRPPNFLLIQLVPGSVSLIGGAILWIVSPTLARALARGNDGGATLSGITETQLYTAVFLALGLYFTLHSFANAFSWLHFLAINPSPDLTFLPDQRPSFYDMTETLLRLAAGLVLVFSCQTWARKLVRRGGNGAEENSPPNRQGSVPDSTGSDPGK